MELNGKSALNSIAIANTTTTGNITICGSQTRGNLNIGTGVNRTFPINIGNQAVLGGPINISCGTGGTSTLTLQGNGGVILSDNTTVSGALSATANTSVSNVVLTSAPGINFGGTNLTVYETGTFTPGISFIGGGGGSLSSLTATGSYMRIGNIVQVSMYFISSGFTGTQTETRITGLPYFASAVGGKFMEVTECSFYGYGAASSNERRTLEIQPSTSYGVLKREEGVASVALEVFGGNCASGSGRTMAINGFYFA